MKEDLRQICEFLEAFINCHVDEEPFEPGLTDAQLMQKCLPSLKSIIDTVESENIEEECRFSISKKSRESVCPNYRYCVVDSNINCCWLTDDYEKAMMKAKSESYSVHKWYVCEIKKTFDDTYRTYIDGFFCDGRYYERIDHNEFLHYDYIARTIGYENIQKI